MNYYSPYYLHTRRNICMYVFAYLTFVSISNYSPSKQPKNLSQSNLSSDILRQIWDVIPIRQYLQNIKYALHCVLIFSLSSWGIKSFFFALFYRSVFLILIQGCYLLLKTIQQPGTNFLNNSILAKVL